MKPAVWTSGSDVRLLWSEGVGLHSFIPDFPCFKAPMGRSDLGGIDEVEGYPRSLNREWCKFLFSKRNSLIRHRRNQPGMADPEV